MYDLIILGGGPAGLTATIYALRKRLNALLITLDLGGKTDMPTIGLKGQPLRIRGRVHTVSDGQWTVSGPMYTGVRVSTGATAVLDTGKVQIVVVSHHHEPWDRGIFTNVGIDPAAKRYLVLKSRIHYRAGFGDVARHTITCDGTGVTSSDNRLFDFQHVRRPIYPLDPFPGGMSATKSGSG